MATTTKKPAKKLTAKKQLKGRLTDDPNAVNDVYTESDLDPAYDETIADDIAFDYDDTSGDPGDHETEGKN